MNKNKAGSNKIEDPAMDVVEHLSELRLRLIFVLMLIIISTCILFYYSEYILDYLTQPFHASTEIKRLNIFGLTEGFSLRLKSSVIASLFLTFPVILLQIWGYIKPAIEKKQRRLFRVNLFFAVLFFYTGSAFAFLMLLPFTIDMLISFIPQKMNNLINASNYLNFIFYMSAGMGAVFELPVIINILTGIGLLTPSFLSGKRKYAIIIIWITAAVITPADVLSQIIVAVPLMFLYELAIIFSWFTYKGYKRKSGIQEK
ncbi:MAG: twin-arginine translocase subunit TatC [Spirochaetes bacterium]|nr:twin-arginine translocase subunit TatC [Spirochaetota bacterium]